MKRGVRVLFLCVLAVAILTIVVPGSAIATHLNSNGICNDGTDTPHHEVCIYKNANLGGSFSDYCCEVYNYYQKTFDYQTSGCGICWMNDQVSSMDNWAVSYKVRFFVDGNYDGARQTLAAFGRDNQANYNDAFSSHCWNDGQPQDDEAGNPDQDCSGF